MLVDWLIHMVFFLLVSIECSTLQPIRVRCYGGVAAGCLITGLVDNLGQIMACVVGKLLRIGLQRLRSAIK